MLMRMSAASTQPVNSALVNCEPWSVLKMSGVPGARASSSAVTQKLAPRVLETRQESTQWLYQSITATR